MQFEIKHRFSGAVIFTAEIECAADYSYSLKLGLAVKAAVAADANLQSADLRSADLRYANLQSANLRYADLRSADLRYANLQSADLQSADLQSANLRYADLRYANLRSADLQEIKKDFLARLALAKNEALGLYDYLVRGKVDGSSYEGDCCCFVGTIAKVCDQTYDALTSGLKPDSDSPTERWFFGISKGDTPQNNQVSAITAEWVREFMAENGISVPEYKLVSSLEYPDAFKAVA